MCYDTEYDGWRRTDGGLTDPGKALKVSRKRFNGAVFGGLKGCLTGASASANIAIIKNGDREQLLPAKEEPTGVGE